VLDLGCAVGDQAAQLVARGARVIGFDMNDDLLQAARGRQMPNADFRRGDLRALPDPGIHADGLWCSFAAGYFTKLPPILVQWSRHLRPGAWIALTEVYDLFGHTPLSHRARSAFQGYAEQALAEGRYDFYMGHKLKRHAEEAGLVVTRCFTVPDAELSFDGPANSEVSLAWRNRLDGMKLLQEFCGADFSAVRDEFLAAISHPDHRSDAKVFCVLASTPPPPPPEKLQS
jgi:SAM-dependent methyltransferase